MTEEEYQKQAEEETRRGLEELRKHCNSPEFNPWKTVSRLQSPKRFTCDVRLYIFMPKLMKKNKRNTLKFLYNSFMFRKYWNINVLINVISSPCG